MAADFAELAIAFQAAQGEWLAAQTGIVSAFGANPVRIHGAVDERTGMPCLQTGEDSFLPADLQDSPARICSSRVHIWTRESGMTLCKTIGGAVLSAFTVTGKSGANNGFSVAGFQLVYGFNTLERYMRDPMPGVRHGVLDFELRFVPAA